MKALPPDKSANQNGKSAGGGQHGNGRDFAPGYDARRGHGPTKGHGGRPKHEWIARMEGLAARDVPEEILSEIRPEILERLLREHPAIYVALQRLRLEAWCQTADRAWDKPRAAPETLPDAPDVVEVTRKLTVEEWRLKYGSKR